MEALRFFETSRTRHPKIDNHISEDLNPTASSIRLVAQTNLAWHCIGHSPWSEIHIL